MERGNGYLPPDDALNKDVPAPLELAAWAVDLAVANSVSRTIRHGTGSVYKSKNAAHSSEQLHHIFCGYCSSSGSLVAEPGLLASNVISYLRGLNPL